MAEETARDVEDKAPRPGGEMSFEAESEPDFGPLNPDTIGALARAQEHLHTAAGYLMLGGNPVEPGELAAHLRDLAETFSLALSAAHPWPWAGSDTQIEETSRRAARLASELKDVLEELTQKPSPWGPQAKAEVYEPTDEQVPLEFRYPPYMDAATAAYIFADRRRRGLVSEAACRRADTTGVTYVRQEFGARPSSADWSSGSTR
ncbi:hypothetical protein [Streptomyces sp. NPDC006140]|uniref:hypothetical protein n=1 Tax=Streptomyces sp. NPDC006140 TaxID=3154579 RepID=UPI0033F56F7E